MEMAKEAFIVIDGIKTLREASSIQQSERFELFRCANEDCNCELTLRAFNSTKISPYFGGNHRRGCNYASSRRTVSTDEYNFKLDDIINHQDNELIKKEKIQEPDDQTKDLSVSKDERKDNPEIVDEVIKVNRTKKLYYLATTNPDIIQTSGYNLNDFYISIDTIDKFRKIDFSYTRVLIALKKCSPSNLNPPIYRPDYFACFVDAYTRNLRKAIYFMVKLKERTHNQIFWKKIRNMRDGDLLVIYTDKFVKTKNDNYLVYTADNLNSWEYFIDAK